MPDDEDNYLAELLEWVQQHEAEEGVGEFLKAYEANHGETLYALAKTNPNDALVICEMLFEMVEELYDDSDEMHQYFSETQPKPPPDERQLLL
jgi:uncharacterized lipoprotein YajG